MLYFFKRPLILRFKNLNLIKSISIVLILSSTILDLILNFEYKTKSKTFLSLAFLSITQFHSLLVGHLLF